LRSGEYYSKGKFLLSGEYFVLYGAKALALPLKFGQKMLVREIPEPGIIDWETFVMDKRWFTARIGLKDMSIPESSDQKTAVFIRDLLRGGGKLQPELRLTSHGFSIRNYLDFDISWGLGSSSSLVSNLAWWLDIDPYSLYRSTFHGSGYDVFCARANGPMTFKLKDDQSEIREIDFRPVFTDHLYFIYTGRKQDTQESVKEFRSRPLRDEKIISQVSDLTEAFIKSSDFEDFSSLINAHEALISAAIGIPPVKEQLFPDFKGEIKSLGAWGGDFVMAATALNDKEVKEYFHQKNLDLVFKWDEIIY
jgi:mevalonate kinase